MKKVLINDNWRLVTNFAGELKATVPGCLHTDLLNNDVITDVFWRDDNKKYQYLENEFVTYYTYFDAEINVPCTLVFEGLDTYAEVFLNGTKIGSCEDMFIPYEFDVTNLLKEKDNKLSVEFRSPIKEVENKEQLEAAFTCERLHTRRIQCTYGWDWVDRYVTMGIYKNVYLKYTPDMYVENVYVACDSIDNFSAGIYVDIEFKNANQGGLVHVDILDPDNNVVEFCDFYSKEDHVIRHFDIVNPKLWYPNGYGEHPLYTIKVCVAGNEFSDTFGIRTIKLMQISDTENSDYYNKAKNLQANPVGKVYDKNDRYSGFQLIVNGRPILCLGGNWVPCEPFPSAETKEKISTLISEAVSMNANFLRVWGGGIFESDDFYYECDKNGIIVVQDFLMACGHYPEKEDWFIKALNKESEYAVKKLRNHPCLAWWHGDNENAQEGSDLQEDYTGRDTAFKGIAPNVNKYDRFRQFLPSSPYGGNLNASITRGTTHNSNYILDTYEYFYNEKCDNYKEFLEMYLARFISEEPTFGAVENSSMLKFMNKDDLCSKSEEIIDYHSKTNPFLPHTIFEYTRIFAEKVLGKFEDVGDKLFKYRYIQYEWIRVLFENCRSNLGYNNGLVFWMFDDCWPASLGWSIIDYYCQPKAAYYIFKRLAKDITASVKHENNAYKVYISNKQNTKNSVTVLPYTINISTGKREDYASFNLDVDGYSVKSATLQIDADDNTCVFVDIKYNNETDRAFYKEGALHLKKTSAFEIIEQTDSSVTVKANENIHAFSITGEFIFSDNYFILHKGEQKTINFKTAPICNDKTIDFLAYSLK